MIGPIYFGMYNNFFKGFTYTIQPKDTLEIISKRYRVPVNQIIIMNKLSYPYILKEGTKIFIPGLDEPIAPDGGSIYTVKYGDNLNKISKKFNTNVEEIMDKNYLSNKYSIYIGQKLLIPSPKDSQGNLGGNIVNVNSQGEHNEKNEIKIYQSAKDIPINNYKTIGQIGNKFSMIKIGDKGKDIAVLKRLVSALGYKIRKHDTYFDIDLERHIKKIQKNAGLEENGYVDQNVWEHIFGLINNMPGMYN